jgi:SH3 domain protein
MPRRRLTVPFAAASALLLAQASGAEPAWVKGEVLLNVRVGPGTEYRPLGAITTGDAVDILQQGESWTRVRTEKTGEGWIPAGFLQDAPPPIVRLERAESEATKLRQRVEELAAEAERLRAAHAEASARASEQAQEIEHLANQNATLRADAIWPVMLVGASILVGGGMIGAWLRGARRGAGNRVRL